MTSHDIIELNFVVLHVIASLDRSILSGYNILIHSHLQQNQYSYSIKTLHEFSDCSIRVFHVYIYIICSETVKFHFNIDRTNSCNDWLRGSCFAVSMTE